MPKEKSLSVQSKEEMKQSPIEILKSEVIEKTKNIEDEDVLVVAGRGVHNEKDVEMCEELAKALGGQLAFTRPMIDEWFWGCSTSGWIIWKNCSSKTDHYLWSFWCDSVYILYDRI